LSFCLFESGQFVGLLPVLADCHISFLVSSCNAVVTSETKLKQNKRKTMFCFSEIVLFQFRFSVFIDMKQNAETKQN